MAKAITAELNTWANESEARRGVLNHQVEVLTLAMMDIGIGDESSWLVMADLIGTSRRQVVQNIEKIERVSGAAQIWLGPGRVTFAEVRSKVVALACPRLEPLVASAGQSVMHVMKGADASADRFHLVNVDGTVRLIQCASNSGVRPFVMLSSIKVHGEAGHVSETSPRNDADPYGGSKRDAEDRVFEIGARTGM